MQFSIISVVAALAATATAAYVPTNGTTPHPSGTAASTGSQPTSTSSVPSFEGGAAMPMAGSALSLVIAGGVALML